MLSWQSQFSYVCVCVCAQASYKVEANSAPIWCFLGATMIDSQREGAVYLRPSSLSCFPVTRRILARAFARWKTPLVVDLEAGRGGFDFVKPAHDQRPLAPFSHFLLLGFSHMLGAGRPLSLLLVSCHEVYSVLYERHLLLDTKTGTAFSCRVSVAHYCADSRICFSLRSGVRPRCYPR